MSCYTNFYVRKNDTFIPILSSSRNGSVSVFLENIDEEAPWGEYIVINKARLSRWFNSIHADIAEAEKKLNNVLSERTQILSANNTLEEKVAYLNDSRSVEEYYQEQIKDAEYLDNLFLFFSYIIDENFNYNSKVNNILYYGMEAGEPVLGKNVIED